MKINIKGTFPHYGATWITRLTNFANQIKKSTNSSIAENDHKIIMSFVISKPGFAQKSTQMRGNISHLGKKNINKHQEIFLMENYRNIFGDMNLRKKMKSTETHLVIVS